MPLLPVWEPIQVLVVNSNMAIKRFLFSSLLQDNRLITDLAIWLKPALESCRSFVFVPSGLDPIYPAQEDEDLIIQRLREIGIHFDHVHSLDETSDFYALLKQADVIYLHGGNPLVFYQLMLEKGCLDLLKDPNKVIMGLSAGSMLLSDRIMLSPSNQEYQDFVALKAVGSVNFSVYPHVNHQGILSATNTSGDGQAHLQDLLDLSYYSPIVLMSDGQVVVSDLIHPPHIIGGSYFYLDQGNIYWRNEDGKVYPVDPASVSSQEIPKDALKIRRIYGTMAQALAAFGLPSDGQNKVPYPITIFHLEEVGVARAQVLTDHYQVWVLTNPHLRYGSLVFRQVDRGVEVYLRVVTRYQKWVERSLFEYF